MTDTTTNTENQSDTAESAAGREKPRYDDINTPGYLDGGCDIDHRDHLYDLFRAGSVLPIGTTVTYENDRSILLTSLFDRLLKIKKLCWLEILQKESNQFQKP